MCHESSGSALTESIGIGKGSVSLTDIHHADLVLVIGSSGLVHPVAGLPLRAKERGAYVVDLNPEPSGLSSRADLHWRDSAAAALPLLLQRWPAD
jgi:NAD-dependent deacetylase